MKLTYILIVILAYLSGSSSEVSSSIDSTYQDGTYLFIWTQSPNNYHPSDVAIYSNLTWVPYRESRPEEHAEAIEILKLRFKRLATDSYGWQWTTNTGPWTGGTEVVEQTNRVREEAEQMLSNALKRSRDAGRTNIKRISL